MGSRDFSKRYQCPTGDAISSLNLLGLPAITQHFTGIDQLGQECRIANTVTILRFDSTTTELFTKQTIAGICLGDRVSIYDYGRLVIGDPSQHPNTGITLGNNIIINTFCYLSGEGGLQIEDEVLIGSHVKILSAGHVMDEGEDSIWCNPINYDKIYICKGTWIAAGATILQGVHIGRGAVIGAGSVVTRDVPDFAIVAGNPARLIRYRKGYEPKRKRFWWLLQK